MLARLKFLLTSPWVIVLAALLIRLGATVYGRAWQINPELDHYAFGFETGRVARAIAAGEGFSSPLHGQTGPTAWLMPVYPYLLAGIFSIFGIYSTASAVVAIVLNCIFSALTCLPIYHIGRRTLGEGVALGAAWVWVFYYQAIHLSITWIWDTSLTTLLASTVFLLALGLHQREDWRTWATFGALCAITGLSSASMLAVLPALGLWLAVRRRRAGTWIRQCAAAAAVLLLLLAPWAIRNYRVFGKFVFPRSNLGLELFLGTVEDKPEVGFYWMHPSMNIDELAKYRKMGELAYMAEKRQLALAAIAENPGELFQQTLKRIELCWVGPWHLAIPQWQRGGNISKKLLLTTLVTVLALVGFLLIAKRKEMEPMLYGIFLFFYPLVYYLTHDSPRYRHPIDPLVVLLAVYGAARLAVGKKRAPANA